MLRLHAQYIMLKKQIFIHEHVAIQSFTIWYPTHSSALQQTISNQLCCMSDHRYPVKSDLKFSSCFSLLSWSLSWLIVSTACWYNRNLFPSLIVILYINQFNLSWCLRHPNYSLPGQGTCFPLGMVAWLPCTPDFLRWQSYAVSLFQPQELLVCPTYIRIPSIL